MAAIKLGRRLGLHMIKHFEGLHSSQNSWLVVYQKLTFL